MAGRSFGDSVYVGVRVPLEIVRPFRPPYEPSKHGDAVLNTLFPKSVIYLKSMKYLPVVKLATAHTPSQVMYEKTKKIKREATNNIPFKSNGSSVWKADTETYVKIESPTMGEPRQKPLVPSWSTVQYNRRPIINTPWMKDTQGIAMTTMNNINGAMLELSDTDIQRETAKANLVLVQRMGELVQAEKDKVKAEMNQVQSDIERMVSERERNLMEIQKLEMEKEVYETRLLSGSARAAQKSI